MKNIFSCSAIAILLLSSNGPALAQPAQPTEESFDIESFFKELEAELKKAEEQEAAHKAPKGSDVGTPATRIPEQLPPTPVITPLPLPEKVDPESIFVTPELQTVEIDRQKITEPTHDSIEAFHTVMDDNSADRPEPTYDGFITHLTKLKNTIMSRSSSVSDHFRSDFRTLYQTSLEHIVIMINQIGGNINYIKLFLVPPQTMAKDVDETRRKIVACLKAIKKVLPQITIINEEEEPIALLQALAHKGEPPTKESDQEKKHHHHDSTFGEYRHKGSLSSLEQSINNALNYLSSIEKVLTTFVTSKEIQEATQKLVDAQTAKEKAAQSKRAQKTYQGGTADWWRSPHQPSRSPYGSSMAPYTSPQTPWWNNINSSWNPDTTSSSGYAPSTVGASTPTSQPGGAGKQPPGKVTKEKDKEADTAHGRSLDQAGQDPVSHAINTINRAAETAKLALAATKAMTPDEAAQHLLATGTLSKLAHQFDRIEEAQENLPEDRTEKASQTGGTKKRGRIARLMEPSSSKQPDKIKAAEKNLGKNLAELAPLILRAATIMAPGKEQEQTAIPKLYQQADIRLALTQNNNKVIEDRAQELLKQDYIEEQKQLAAVRGIDALAQADALRVSCQARKQRLERLVSQFPFPPEAFKKRLEQVNKQLNKIGARPAAPAAPLLRPSGYGGQAAEEQAEEKAAKQVGAAEAARPAPVEAPEPEAPPGPVVPPAQGVPSDWQASFSE
jgi:hypothetical protein